MLLAGFAVVWLAYGVGLPGWGLLRGWDITLRQYWSPFHSYGADGQKWPPPKIPPDRVFPGPASSGGKVRKRGGQSPTAGESVKSPLSPHAWRIGGGR